MNNWAGTEDMLLCGGTHRTAKLSDASPKILARSPYTFAIIPSFPVISSFHESSARHPFLCGTSAAPGFLFFLDLVAGAGFEPTTFRL
jgi:hypothetical protein